MDTTRSRKTPHDLRGRGSYCLRRSRTCRYAARQRWDNKIFWQSHHFIELPPAHNTVRDCAGAADGRTETEFRGTVKFIDTRLFSTREAHVEVRASKRSSRPR